MTKDQKIIRAKAGLLELAKQLRPGDVVLTLGAGDVWKVGEYLLRRRRSESATLI